MSLAILGNGISRDSLEEEIKLFDEVWVCNNGVYEFGKFPNIKRVYSVHQDFLEEISKEKFIKKNKIVLVGEKKTRYSEVFKEVKGWSSGNQAILDALLEDYPEIYLFGFDFGGEDFYQDYLTEGSNFKKQYEQILKDEKLNAEDRLFLRYPEEFFIKNKIKNKTPPSKKYSIFDLKDDNFSDEELDFFVEEASLFGGIIHGKDISFQQNSVCGRLIKKLKRVPLTSKRDDTWLFYINGDSRLLKEYLISSKWKEFDDLVKGKNLVFVGPSPILVDQNKGDFIDSFDIVVRTNNMLNTLLDNENLKKDYGSRTDILYTNVTYEKNSFEEWRIYEWTLKGLKFLVRKFRDSQRTIFPFPWRKIRYFLDNKPKKNYSLGVHLINELLQTSLKSLYVIGIDGYVTIPDEIQEENKEYIEGYLPKFHLDYRKNNLGGKVSTHDKKADSEKILEMAKEDSRLILDEEVLKSLKEVSYGEK